MQFLSLPAEVRTHIYSFTNKKDKDALWSTCRQIHDDLTENTDYKINKLRRILLRKGLHIAHNGPTKEFCFSLLFRVSLTQLKEKKIEDLTKTYDRLVSCLNEMNEKTQRKPVNLSVFPAFKRSPQGAKRILEFLISRKYGSFEKRINEKEILPKEYQDFHFSFLWIPLIKRTYGAETALEYFHAMNGILQENFPEHIEKSKPLIILILENSLKPQKKGWDEDLTKESKHLDEFNPDTSPMDFSMLGRFYSDFEESLSSLNQTLKGRNNEQQKQCYLIVYHILSYNDFPFEGLYNIISSIENTEVKKGIYTQILRDVARSENTELYENLLEKALFTDDEMKIADEFDQYRQKHTILKKYTYHSASIKDQKIHAICTSLFEEIKELSAYMKADILTALYVRTFIYTNSGK